VRFRAGTCLLGAVLALALAAPARALSPTVTEFSTGLSSADDVLDIANGPDGNLWFADAVTGGALGRVSTSGSITKFSAGLSPGGSPQFVAAGPDGNVWFSDASGANPAIGRIDPAGTITEFALPSGSVPAGITTGPDGNLWFADQGSPPAIGRVTPVGAVHEFTSGLNAGARPRAVAAGPDGNVWFTDQGTSAAIGRITPGGTIHEFSSGLSLGSVPQSITNGPDGNVWFTDQGTPNAIGRITPTGAIHEFTSGLNPGSRPEGITVGPDNALWFADSGTPPALGRVFANTGDITEVSGGLRASSVPLGVAPGADGNVWFTDNSASSPAIGRITTPPTATTVAATATGATTAAILGLVDGHAQPSTFHVEYGAVGGSIASTRGQSLGTTVGPTRVSAALSRLRPNTAYQARILGVNATDTTTGEFVTFRTGPPADRISRFKLRPKVMIAASRGGTVRAARTPGALISYTGSQPATTTFTVERKTLGRRAGKNCVKRNRRNRSHRTCTLYVKVGRFKHKDPAGRVRFRFMGRLHGRTLHVGDYRLIAEPHSAGGIGRTVHKNFSVKAAPKHKKKHSRT
jgi:streptogramin lyase